MIACAITLGVTCFGLVSCGDNEEETTSQERHDSTKCLPMKNYLK